MTHSNGGPPLLRKGSLGKFKTPQRSNSLSSRFRLLSFSTSRLPDTGDSDENHLRREEGAAGAAANFRSRASRSTISLRLGTARNPFTRRLSQKSSDREKVHESSRDNEKGREKEKQKETQMEKESRPDTPPSPLTRHRTLPRPPRRSEFRYSPTHNSLAKNAWAAHSRVRSESMVKARQHAQHHRQPDHYVPTVFSPSLESLVSESGAFEDNLPVPDLSPPRTTTTSHSELRPELRPESKPESKLELKSVSKPESESESRSRSKPDPRPNLSVSAVREDATARLERWLSKYSHIQLDTNPEYAETQEEWWEQAMEPDWRYTKLARECILGARCVGTFDPLDGLTGACDLTRLYAVLIFVVDQGRGSP
jgi:hypothetical protein